MYIVARDNFEIPVFVIRLIKHTDISETSANDLFLVLCTRFQSTLSFFVGLFNVFFFLIFFVSHTLCNTCPSVANTLSMASPVCGRTAGINFLEYKKPMFLFNGTV